MDKKYSKIDVTDVVPKGWEGFSLESWKGRLYLHIRTKEGKE